MLQLFSRKYVFFAELPRSLKALILNSFVVAFASFMVTPFLAIFLEHTIGMNLRSVGYIVAMATFIQFGGGLAGGWTATRFGLRSTMIFSLGFRTIGFFLLALSVSQHWLVIPAVFLVAAGPALYLPANRAYIVASVSGELRPLFLSVGNAALNAGMAIGPVIAALFIDTHPFLLLVGVGLVFLGITISHHLTLKPAPNDGKISPISFSQNFPAALQKARVPVIMSTLTFYTYFFFQNFMGIYVAKVATLKIYSYCTLLNFLLLFILQPALASRIAKISYRNNIAIGFSSMAFGLAMLSIGNVPALFLGTAIMTVGQTLLFLKNDLEMINALPEIPAMAFGIQRLCAGIGGLFSGIFGGFLFDQNKNSTTIGTFWLVVAFQCLILAAMGFGATKDATQRSPRLHEA